MKKVFASLGLFVWLFAPVALAAGPTSAKAVKLEQGKPIEREIGKGETHIYEVAVPPGKVVSGVVDQRGIDLMVKVLDPKGVTVATIDSPNGSEGPEPWALVAKGKKAATWRLEVSPLVGQAGKYQARIDEIITLEEHAERLAALRYKSPRMLKLWKEWRAKGKAAIDSFAKEMDGHAPLVEPVADDPHGDVLLTFVRRNRLGTPYVGLLNGPTVVAFETQLLPFEKTDLYYLTMRAPRDSRFTYNFRSGDPPDAGATRMQLLALLLSTLELDPWNPRRFLIFSFVELPAAPPQPWTQRTEGVAQGRVIVRTLHSDILNEDRKIGVYLPAAFDPAGGPYPYVVVFDGEAYGLDPEPLVPIPVILDNLIAQGKVPPMLAVLVASQSTRNHDLGMWAPFGNFLAQELAPWVRREYRGTDDPSKVTLTGSSLGGLSSAYCAFHHPEVFGNVLSQSGAFWFSPGMDLEKLEPTYRPETGGMMREIMAAPKQPVRFWMEVGIFEGSALVAGGNQVAQNRHMRDVLILKGYSVSYHEFSGGHDYLCWRGSIADGLMELAGTGAPQPAKP